MKPATPANGGSMKFDRPRNSPLTPQEMETALHLYLNEGWGVPRISLHMKIRQSTIDAAFKKHQVPIRSVEKTKEIQKALRERGVYVVKKRAKFARAELNS